MRAKGDAAERKALTYLKRQGLKLQCQNYRTQRGEIDLIMRDQNTLVFVEVRSKSNTHFGHPLETIDHAKQQRIINTAKHYLHHQGLTDRVKVRFDAIAITPNELQWVKDAFSS